MHRVKEHRPFSSRGTVSVEYALLLPALLMFLFGIIDAGRLMWTQTAISHAVQAAARCGAVNSMDCGTLSQITNYAVTQAFGVNITSSAFTASTAGCGVLVVAHFPFNFTVPFIVTSNITLNATACYPS